MHEIKILMIFHDFSSLPPCSRIQGNDIIGLKNNRRICLLSSAVCFTPTGKSGILSGFWSRRFFRHVTGLRHHDLRLIRIF